MVVYAASNSPSPLIPWQNEAPAFNVTDLDKSEAKVRTHFTLPHVYCVGSHTGCGCGFNEGREHPQVYDDPVAARAAALESSSRLAQYIREHKVEQLYSCWSGDEADPQEFERCITIDELTAEDFFFRERELLTIKAI